MEALVLMVALSGCVEKQLEQVNGVFIIQDTQCKKVTKKKYKGLRLKVKVKGDSK